MLVENKTKTLKGSKILFETLKNLGVDTIFGYPGGIVLDVYNELFNQSDIKHILVRHEQSAVHAAEGYARETGKCGVVLVTSGPGATNTVSGIVNAYLDGYPLIVITGQVFQNLLGKNAFQEANICDITKSCTKQTFQITSASEISTTFNKAFKIATSGKKGPVVIDIVKDVFSEQTPFNSIETLEEEQSVIISDSAISRIYNRLKSSQKPVIVAGGGIVHSKSEQELFDFAKSYSIPVVNTMMGLGTFPQDDNNYFGMIGIFGDKSANEIIKESDLIISLGARFNDRITCVFKDTNIADKFIQIDINKDEISQFIQASDYYIGDAKQFLSLIKDYESIDFSVWNKKAQTFKTLNKQRERQTNLLHSFEVIRKIEEFTKGKNITFTSEVGQHQLWAVQNLKFNKDRKIFVSGGSGTMGFGFPAAIGAAVANPEKTIVCITGDGSFQMGLHELATCMDNNLNIKIMILNNGYLGMVRQLQEKLCDGNYSQTKISNPDFLTLAKSYGANALRVTTLEEIDSALNAAFSTTGTFIIDFVVEPMETL
ncbi:biosynthetic-type acetolactate synthase large subunit [bacterium]|nr:biosynthetic-type acetolactate synthase large subunit [bacterium]